MSCSTKFCFSRYTAGN
ncbi:MULTISPECIES: peptide IlvX [Kosakonia]|uniref:Peptide IlvX n=1 Tax=Kosakonia oryzae TaxID=497725 RepID=A0ABX7PYJ1_9ENTR|nr:peptide IlvX [Kosakonia oryzae]